LFDMLSVPWKTQIQTFT